MAQQSRSVVAVLRLIKCVSQHHIERRQSANAIDIGKPAAPGVRLGLLYDGFYNCGTAARTHASSSLLPGISIADTKYYSTAGDSRNSCSQPATEVMYCDRCGSSMSGISRL